MQKKKTPKNKLQKNSCKKDPKFKIIKREKTIVQMLKNANKKSHKRH